jgi:hypothetical protein
MTVRSASIEGRDLASLGEKTIGVGGAMLAGAIGAGIVLGVAYTLSPMSVWFVLSVVWLMSYARRGFDDRERRWITAVLVTALLARVVLVIVLLLRSPHDSQGALMLFGDEAYAQRRALRLRLIWARMPGSPWDYINAFDEYGWTGFLYLLAYVQLLFGPAPFGMRLVNAALFVAGVLVLFRLVRNAYGFLPALVGMTILLFLPSLFVWSISLLKESMYFLLTASMLVATVTIVRAPSWRVRLRLGALCIALLVGIGLLRPGGVGLTVIGIAIGITLWLLTRRLRFTVLAFAIAVPLVVAAVRMPQVQVRVMGALQASARMHGGHAFTVGHSYKVLDPEFYTVPTFYTWTLTPAQAGRYVFRALGSFVLVPAPWQIESQAELAYLPEQVLWYVLVALAPLGIVAGFRRDALVTAMQIGFMAAAATGVALTSGNVGTLIRHRALTTPFLVWFSALGLIVAVTWLSRAMPVARESHVDH